MPTTFCLCIFLVNVKHDAGFQLGCGLAAVEPVEPQSLFATRPPTRLPSDPTTDLSSPNHNHQLPPPTTNTTNTSTRITQEHTPYQSLHLHLLHHHLSRTTPTHPPTMSLNPPPTEDAATILDHFISDTLNLPSELSHIYAELSAKDTLLSQHHTTFTTRDQQLQKHIRTYGSHDTSLTKEPQLIDQARKNLKRVQELQDEKLALAAKAVELLDRHARRLDAQIAGLVREGVMGAEALTPAPPASNLPQASQAVRILGRGVQVLERGSRQGTPSGHSGTRKTGRKKPVEKEAKEVAREVMVGGVDDMEVEGEEGEDKRLYCMCQQVSYGSMVGCDDKECPYEWFHWGCVGLTEEPKGKWFCPTCEGRRARKRGAS